jgi:carbon-monoxide dehydrogenase large subunit
MTDRPEAGGRFVGQSVLRREDPRLLSGRGRYVADVQLRGQGEATFVRSTVARGRIVRLDVDAARSAPGVRAVLTAEDINSRLQGPMVPSLYLMPGAGKVAPLRLLAEQDVRFVGDPIVLIVADNRYLAEDAADLVDVEFDPLAPIVDYELAAEAQELVHEEEEGNVVAHAAPPPSPGYADALAGAALVVTERFRQHRYSAVPMETRGVAVEHDPYSGQLDIWLSTQNPHEARRVASRITGIPERRVRVRSGDVGGGFGQKSFLGREEQAVIIAAQYLGQPVKWVEDRMENLVSATHSRVARADVTMALDEDGLILATAVDHLEDVGAYPIGGGAAHSSVGLRFPFPYRIPEHSWSSTVVWTNTCGRGAYRGPWMMETVAREAMIDVAARRLGMDPLDLRRRNVLRPEDLPYTTATNLVVENVSPQRTLEEAAAAIDYDGFRQLQADARREGRLLGIGTALYIEPQTSMATYKTEQVHMRLSPDGSVDVYLGSGDHGQGLVTTTAQLAAEYLGVSIEDVAVHQGDTDSTPFGPGTGGSRSGPMIGAAVLRASSTLQGTVRGIAAHLMEAAPEDLEVADGVVSVRGTPVRSVTVAEVARVAYDQPGGLPPGTPIEMETVERFTAPATMYSNACHMCTVDVDPASGRVSILRYVVAEDCGQMINPAVVEGQIAGGVVQGIGGVLLEENVYDADGNPLSTTLMDYLLPTAAEAPPISYVHISTPASTPGDFKGVGEGGAIGAPAAVLNAIADAVTVLGVELRDQPASPDRLRALIRQSTTESPSVHPVGAGSSSGGHLP